MMTAEDRAVFDAIEAENPNHAALVAPRFFLTGANAATPMPHSHGVTMQKAYSALLKQQAGSLAQKRALDSSNYARESAAYVTRTAILPSEPPGIPPVDPDA